MDLVTIDRYTSLAAANIARATLEAAGIEAVLADEIDAHAHGGVRLQVAREDVADAFDVLRDANANTPADEAVSLPPLEPGDTCRRCGSEEIYPVISRARAYAHALIISMLSGIAVQGIAILARMTGVAIPPRVLNGAFLILLSAPLLTALLLSLSPRMTCRNCQATWRGEQWIN